MAEEPLPRYRCRCGETKGLYREVDVSGWQAVDDRLELATPRYGPAQEADWSEVEPTGGYGCGECGWQGFVSGLERVGTDGEALAEPIPGQQELAL